MMSAVSAVWASLRHFADERSAPNVWRQVFDERCDCFAADASPSFVADKFHVATLKSIDTGKRRRVVELSAWPGAVRWVGRGASSSADFGGQVDCFVCRLDGCEGGGVCALELAAARQHAAAAANMVAAGRRCLTAELVAEFLFNPVGGAIERA